MVKKRSKYNVDQSDKGKRNRTYDGILFDSIDEMRFYKEVIIEGLKDGSIKSCDRQVKFELQSKFTHEGKTIQPINYKADFVVTYADGSQVVYDVKGMADATAKLKRKMFWYKYPNIDYRWVSRSVKYGKNGWIDYDELQKIRRENKKSKTNKNK